MATEPDLLLCGDIEIEGRMPWSSNATFLVRLRADESEETTEAAATDDDPFLSIEPDTDESSAFDDEDDLSAGFEKLFG